MRSALLLLVVLLAACEPPPQHFRLVTLESHEGLGLRLSELPEATLQSIGLGYGLAVIRPGRAGERAGLRVGDVVHGVGSAPIRSVTDFSKALAQPREGRVELLVRRGKTDVQVPLEVSALDREGGALKLPGRSRDTLLRI